MDYRTWQKAVSRLCAAQDVSEVEKITRIQNSLVKPALDLAQRTLGPGSTSKVTSLLEKVYGSVDDPHELLNAFHNTLQGKQKSSEYLTQLYLLLGELQHQGVVDVHQASSYLLKQFIYGCHDETLILKLRLEGKESNPPDYGSLLLAILKEEAMRTRKQVAAKMAKAQQVSEVAAEGSRMVDALRKEVESLKKELKAEREKPYAAELNELRHEVTQLKHCQVSSEVKQESRTQSRQSSQPATRRKLRFCFKCGLDNHTVWSCRNDANPQLVCRRFQEAKQQENGKGSK